MNGFLGASLLLIAALAAVQASGPSTRIVGGTPASITEYPWIVQVEVLDLFSVIWSQSCAAIIVTSRFVISAAHCFEGIFYAPGMRRIRAGSSDRNIGGVLNDVLREYNHPTYNPWARDGDITVVQLVQQFQYNPAIQPATIIAPNSIIPDNMPTRVAGYGQTQNGGNSSNELHHAEVYTLNNAVCREMYEDLNEREGYSYNVTENMICAGVPVVGGKDACLGDSGGPLSYETLTIGVVSWGHGCANGTYPGVYTSISPYTEWIIQIIEQYN